MKQRAPQPTEPIDIVPVPQPTKPIEIVPVPPPSLEIANSSPSAHNSLPTSSVSKPGSQAYSIQATLTGHDTPPSSSSSDHGSTGTDSSESEAIFQADAQPSDMSEANALTLQTLLARQCLKNPKAEYVDAALQMWIEVTRQTQESKAKPQPKPAQSSTSGTTHKTVLHGRYRRQPQSAGSSAPESMTATPTGTPPSPEGNDKLAI